MKCPFCGHDESQVKDSRTAEDGTATRRRRSCTSCGARFTTYERVQLREFSVLKSDGSREAFDREKLARSLRVALRKRDIESERLNRAVTSILGQIEASGETVVESRAIGDLAMQALLTLDKIGYIRYASVYKDFRSEDDFNAFLETLKS